MSEEKKEKEKSAEPTEELKETGSANLENSRDSHRIKLLTIVGEIEGHEAVSGNTKATKYEHLLPLLAEVEDSNEIDGLLILLNTPGCSYSPDMICLRGIVSPIHPCSYTVRLLPSHSSFPM